MDGETIEYSSADSMDHGDAGILQHYYQIEFLNELKLGGDFPPHILQLKLGMLVMLLQNLDPQNGLCNGTQMVRIALHKNVIEIEITTGTHQSDRVFIQCIGMTPSPLDMPFTMRQQKFPLQLTFGMTINKSQGQTLSRIGVLLLSPIFSHGQLYVTLSRASLQETIEVVVQDNDAKNLCQQCSFGCTMNIVYKDILQKTCNQCPIK